MTEHRTPWRADVSAVPADERRLARYALQFFGSDERLRQHLSDPDFLGALWRLALPLLEPGAAARCLAVSQDANGEQSPSRLDRQLNKILAAERGQVVEDGQPEPLAGLANRLREVFKPLPDDLLSRLSADDGDAPVFETGGAFR
ncbi:hypothetical protein [uncultured Thiocystis sp.]|jgi:hypothetical protein|uniref:hypothetical protein n=1 Tax=uncultured Thiocystis sp. TaxID=1202134 RepID=UPI0025E2860B|nr:hypothetical protein [uncultured Thiocystis sp.]